MPDKDTKRQIKLEKSMAELRQAAADGKEHAAVHHQIAAELGVRGRGQDKQKLTVKPLIPNP
jgi:hypothetical protein